MTLQQQIEESKKPDANFYGEDFSYIHLKFGHMHKAYFFTNEFREKYPNFCKEYELFWNSDKKCRFHSPLEIAQYVDLFEVPIAFYYNFTDTPSKSIIDVYEYCIREYSGITYEYDGKMRKEYQKGLDGEEPTDKNYKVVKVEK